MKILYLNFTYLEAVYLNAGFRHGLYIIIGILGIMGVYIYADLHWQWIFLCYLFHKRDLKLYV